MSLPYRVLLCTCPESAVEKVVDGLLLGKLAACVNVLPGVVSRYWWKGKVEAAPECLLVMKARAGSVPAIAKALASLHPYDVPELLALPVEEGSEDYLRWIDEVTVPPAKPSATPRKRPKSSRGPRAGGSR